MKQKEIRDHKFATARRIDGFLRYSTEYANQEERKRRAARAKLLRPDAFGKRPTELRL